MTLPDYMRRQMVGDSYPPSVLPPPLPPSPILGIDLAHDFTFADTDGGPVYTKAVIRVASISDFSTGFAVNGVNCEADSADSTHLILKWLKPVPGTTVQLITCNDYPDRAPFRLATLDAPPCPDLVGIFPSTASLAGGSPTTFIDVMCTGVGFTPVNVSEVYFSDQVNSGGFSIPATYTDSGSFHIQVPTGNWPGTTPWAATMHIRSPNAGGPSHGGPAFVWT